MNAPVMHIRATVRKMSNHANKLRLRRPPEILELFPRDRPKDALGEAGPGHTMAPDSCRSLQDAGPVRRSVGGGQSKCSMSEETDYLDVTKSRNKLIATKFSTILRYSSVYLEAEDTSTGGEEGRRQVGWGPDRRQELPVGPVRQRAGGSSTSSMSLSVRAQAAAAAAAQAARAEVAPSYLRVLRRRTGPGSRERAAAAAAAAAAAR
ncbi:unnamed protein product [Sphagnum tenellum]